MDDEDLLLDETPAVKDKKTVLDSGILVSDPQNPGSFSFAGHPVSDHLISEGQASFTITGLGRGNIPPSMESMPSQEIRFTAYQPFSDENRKLFNEVTSALVASGFKFMATYSVSTCVDFWIGTPLKERTHEETSVVVLDDILQMLEQHYTFESAAKIEDCMTLRTSGRQNPHQRPLIEDVSAKKVNDGSDKGNNEEDPKGDITIHLYDYNPHTRNCEIYVVGEGNFDKERYTEIQNRIAGFLRENYMHVIEMKSGDLNLGCVSVAEPRTGFVVHVYNKATETISMGPSETQIYAYLVENIYLLKSLGINDANDLGAKIIKEGIEQMRCMNEHYKQRITHRRGKELTEELLALIQNGKSTEYTETLRSILSNSSAETARPSDLCVTLHGDDLWTYEQFLINWKDFGYDSAEQMKSGIIARGIRPILDVLCEFKKASANAEHSSDGETTNSGGTGYYN